MAKKRKKPPAPPKKEAAILRHTGSEVDIDGATRANQAIFRTMLRYIESPGRSLRQVWGTEHLTDDEESPMISECVSWFVIDKASARGKWPSKRETHWLEIERRVLATLRTKAVDREVDELAKMEAVDAVLHNHIHGVTDEHGETIIKAVSPKTLEGAVGALVKLGQYRDKKRERVLSAMAGAASVDEADVMDVINDPMVEDNLSDEEALQLAMDLAMRRAGIEEVKDGSE